MKRGTVAADAGADDEQVVIEGLGSASVVGERGGDELSGATGMEVDSAREKRRGESESLAPETTESEIDRLRGVRDFCEGRIASESSMVLTISFVDQPWF